MAPEDGLEGPWFDGCACARRVPPTPHNSCVLPELQESLSESMAGASRGVLLQAQSSGTPPPLVPHNSVADS